MSSRWKSLADQVEVLAKQAGDQETAAILARAALALRNVGHTVFDADTEAALLGAQLEHGLGYNEMIRRIAADWLTSHGYRPFEDLAEDTETRGNA